MKLNHLLQGRPLGHPIHPLLIHFPIAAFIMSFLCDVADLLGAGGRVGDCSFLLMLIGVLTGLLAAVFGLADFQTIRRDSQARNIAAQHAFLNVVVIALYGFTLLIRYVEARQLSGVSFFFAAVALTLLGYSGYLGGELVYNHGTAVGRHRRRVNEPERTIEAGGASGEFADVLPAEELIDGHSQRVCVSGTVLVLVRQEGQLFAFQEFCTHRQGPLSEGTYDNCEVTCPWHRSVFDMRTGEPKSGPAKEAIKVFKVREQNGKVQVQV
jgi:uncharacterized membrane protein/nitrite reductase/ring-hydroxylating ferredoxin subunit